MLKTPNLKIPNFKISNFFTEIPKILININQIGKEVKNHPSTLTSTSGI